MQTTGVGNLVLSAAAAVITFIVQRQVGAMGHAVAPALAGREPAVVADAGQEARRMADEVAVMIDARRPLEPAATAAPWEVDGYVRSWVPTPDA